MAETDPGDSDDSNETSFLCWPQLRSNCLQFVPCRLTHRSIHENKYIYSHQTDIVWLLAGQSRAEACFDAKLSGNSVFPLFPPNCLVYFSRSTSSGFVTKSFPQWWLMSWTGHEWDYKTLWPPQHGWINSCKICKEKNITAFSWSLLNHQRRADESRIVKDIDLNS